MAKGWTKVKTVNDAPVNKESAADKRKRIHEFENTLRNTPVMSEDELKKHGIQLGNAKEERENSLVQAYEDKRLKSAKAIKEAQRIIRAREKAKEKKEKASENK